MIRERALKILLVILGLLFTASAYWLTRPVPPVDQMMVALYATLGIFLLLAVRNPSAHRSLIAFTAWSSLAHGAVMAEQALRNVIPRVDLLRAVLPLAVIGLAMIVLAPAKTEVAGTKEQANTASSAA